jgi:hypothetical protein
VTVIDGKGILGRIGQVGNEGELSERNVYRIRFNAEIIKLFGEAPSSSPSNDTANDPKDPKNPKNPKYTENPENPENPENSNNPNVIEGKEIVIDDDSDDENRVIKQIPNGRMTTDISKYVESGSSLKLFFKAAQVAVTLLSPEVPFLTESLFRDCLSQLERPPLLPRLCGMSELELSLTAAVVRIHMRSSGYGLSAPSNAGDDR